MGKGIEKYLSGAELYGNDFEAVEIEEWYEDEKNAYADLVNNEKSYKYGYHELNILHGYSRMKLGENINVLAFGAAYGDELKPIAKKISSATIIDPSSSFANEQAVIKDTRWIKPEISGQIESDGNIFDLVTCLGALHHVPNVEFVLSEMYRVLKVGGILYVREPIVSMGDWTKPRQGLTKRERGIPKIIMEKFLKNTGFEIIYTGYCDFSPLIKFFYSINPHSSLFNNKFLTRLDSLISKAFAFNSKTYHRIKFKQKFAPASVAFVLKKNST